MLWARWKLAEEQLFGWTFSEVDWKKVNQKCFPFHGGEFNGDEYRSGQIIIFHQPRFPC